MLYNKDAKKINGNAFIIITPVLVDEKNIYIGELICSDSYNNYFNAGNYLIKENFLNNLKIDKPSLILANISRFSGNEYSNISSTSEYGIKEILDISDNQDFSNDRDKHISHINMDYIISLKKHSIISNDIDFIRKALFKKIRTDEVIEFYNYMNNKFHIHIDNSERYHRYNDTYLKLEKLDDMKLSVQKSKEPEQLLIYFNPEYENEIISIATTGSCGFEIGGADILDKMMFYDDMLMNIDKTGLYVVSYEPEDASSHTDMGIEYDIDYTPTGIRPMDDRDFFMFDITEDNIKEILDEYKEEGYEIKL